MPNRIDRLRQDLETVQQAAGFGLPFDRRDVKTTLLLALAGLPLATWGLFGSDRAPIPGIAIGLTLLLILAASSIAEKRAVRRDAPPLRWRESKAQLTLFLATTAAALAYLFLGIWGSLTWGVAMAGAIFVAGACMTIPAVLDGSRRHLLGGGVPTMALGAVFPLGEERLWMVAIAAWIVLSGLLTAAIMHQQLTALTLRDEPN